MGYRMTAWDMFEDVSYNKKSSEELRVAMEVKVGALEASCKTRGDRLEKIREEYQIGGEQLANLIYRFRNEGSTTSYEKQGEGPLVPAGAIANIIREREMLDKEGEQIRKMELILRNMKDTELYIHENGECMERTCIHELSDTELEYLGF